MTNKNTILVIVVGAVVTIITIAGILFVLHVITSAPQGTDSAPSGPNTPATHTSQNTPVSGGVWGSVPTTPISVGTPQSASSSAQMTITIQGNATIQVNDFVHRPETKEDAANPGNYMLAGNLGYCLQDQRACQAATTTENNFSIYYYGQSQTFYINLLKLPLGKAREDAEQFLMTMLGITDKQQMCNLKYSVGVTRYVSEDYAGDNLLFSFCPGETLLP